MKRIIFFDGMHGSGKSTLIQALQTRLSKEIGYSCISMGSGFPKEYEMLYNLDEKKGFSSSGIAKLSYKISHLNIAIQAIKKQENTIGLFHKGILHVIQQCLANQVEDNIFRVLTDDLIKNIAPLHFGTICLCPPLDIIFKRLEQRKDPSKKDRDKQYLERCYHLFSQLVNNQTYFDLFGKKIILDTSQLTIQQTCDQILPFIKE